MVSVHPINTLWRRYRAHVRRRPPDALVAALLAASTSLPSQLADDIRKSPLNHYLMMAALHYSRGDPSPDSMALERAWLTLAANSIDLARVLLASMLLDESRFQTAFTKRLNIRLWKLCQGIDAIGLEHVRSLVARLESAKILTATNNKPIDPPAKYVDSVVVCKGPPPTLNGDRDHGALTKQMARLREPIELKHANPFWNKIRDEFPWFEQVIAVLERDLTYRQEGWFRIKPTLMLGPPGIGKSAFARALSSRTQLPLLSLSMAAQTEARGLLGTSRGYASGSPSIVTSLLARHQVANPLLFVDEIEKAGKGGWAGDPVTALLVMIEPETARVWLDPYLQTDVDLSHVNWLAGANSLTGIDSAVLSRFRIVKVQAPSVDHWPTVRTNLLESIAHEAGMPVEAMPILDRTVDAQMRELLRRRGDLRVMRRALEAVVKIDLDNRVAN